MSASQSSVAERRPGARAAAATVLVGLSVIELGALVIPIPLPVLIVSAALIPFGVAAAVAVWTGRGWGRNLGIAVAGVTTIKSAFGVILASTAFARGGAGLALALGPICCGLLVLSAQSDEN